MGEVFSAKGVSAQVIEHTISPQGFECVSMGITGHRYILAEVDTHRVFSRSFRSSRAVPISKMIGEVRASPMMPVVWQYNQKGMQATEQMEPFRKDICEKYWIKAANRAADDAEWFAVQGLHKQWANRGLETYLPFHGIVTSVYWQNFYALRNHPDAMPDFKLLAELMLEAHRASEPTYRRHGEWHLPYFDDEDNQNVVQWTVDNTESEDCGVIDASSIYYARLVSGARCARSSYKVFDEDRKPTLVEDFDLAHRLIASGHWSPFEHQATPAMQIGRQWRRRDLEKFGNLYGYVQGRKLFPYESRVYDVYPKGHPRHSTTRML